MGNHDDMLPLPSLDMTPEEKGVLLGRYVTSATAVATWDVVRKTWDRLNFSGAHILGAKPSFTHLASTRIFLPPDQRGESEEVNFRHANLKGAALHAAYLQRVDFSFADLQEALLKGAFLVYAKLEGANLKGASLQNADLRGADLREVQFQGADLRGATLLGASFGDGDTILNCVDCKISAETYVRSEWRLDMLLRWHRGGGTIVGVKHFPQDIQAWFCGSQEGLTLYFYNRISIVDDILVRGVIVTFLSPDTECRLVEVVEEGVLTRVRISGGTQAELEFIAKSLHKRVWEQQERPRSQVVVNQAPIGQQINIHHLVENSRFDLVLLKLDRLQQAVDASLSELIDRLTRMTIYVPCSERQELAQVLSLGPSPRRSSQSMALEFEE